MKKNKDLGEELQEAAEELFQDWRVLVGLGVAGFGAFLYFYWEAILAELPAIGVAAPIALLTTGLLFVGLALVLIIAIVAIRKAWVYHYNRKVFQYVQILPNTGDEVNVETLGEFVRRVHGAQRGPFRRLMWGREWFTFIIHHNKKDDGKTEYLFYIGAPRDRMGSVKNHMSSLYANAEFYPAKNIKFPSFKAAAGRMTTKRKKTGSSLSLSKYKKDQLPGILRMMEPETWLQLSFSPDSEYKLKQRIRKEEKIVKAGKGWRERDAFDREEEKSFRTRFSGNEVSFNVTVSLASESGRKWSTVRDTADAVAGVMNDVNEIKYKRLPYFLPVQRFPLPRPYTMVWTGSEMAKLFHLPETKGTAVAEKLAEKMPHTKPGASQLPKGVLSSKKGVRIGNLVHPIIEGREVRIDVGVFAKHWFLSGITGSGKSTVLNTLLNSFIETTLKGGRAPGFSFMDPKKETATIVLNNILKKELDGNEVDWSKVKWISFKDADHPPAMNLLHRMPGVDDTVLTDQIMRIIRENNANPAQQAERLLGKCIQTLLADKAVNHTILGVEPLLYREKFRNDILNRLKQDSEYAGLVDFWEYEADTLLTQSASAIMNRLDMFFSNTFLRRIFGQTDFNFPLRKWMDEGYMIFYDFSGMSEQETGLIGGYLSYLYYRVADTRPDRSLTHQLIIDEAQRVKASILPHVIYEMRSKGLALGVSSQAAEQLPEKLQNALANVAASAFSCQQGVDGAKAAAQAFKSPGPDGKDRIVYSEGFLKQLPVLSCVIKTQDEGRPVNCVVKVPPLNRYLPNGEIAIFGDTLEAEREAAKSNAWTYAKAKELEEANGLTVKEIDDAIKNYLHPTNASKNVSRETKKLRPPETPSKVVKETKGLASLLEGDE